MRAIFILLICLGFMPTYAQMSSKPHFSLKAGCYAIGHYSENKASTNFWYINDDSTFINFYVSNDYIKSIRTGKWRYIEDSMISLQYLPLKSSILVHSTVDYRAETKGSADSVYFYGSVRAYDNKPLSYCGIVFDNPDKDFAKFGEAVGYGFKGVALDANGNFNFAISKNYYFGSIGITSLPGYYPLTINTFPNNNYHTLHITLPLIDSANNVDITKFSSQVEFFRYRPSIPGQKMRMKSYDLPINFITGDKAFLLNVLYKAKEKQPVLVGPIDELIEYLKR